MKVIVWPIDENANGEVHLIPNLPELWDLVRAGQEASDGGVSYVREISANVDEDGSHYLVLSWVEMEGGA